jgi:hypothetical protein
MSLVPDDEYILDSSEYANKIPSKTGIRTIYSISAPHYITQDKEILLFDISRSKRITFTDFGKLKDFHIRAKYLRGTGKDAVYIPVLTFHKSYLSKLESSQPIPEPNINNMYCIEFQAYIGSRPHEFSSIIIKRLVDLGNENLSSYAVRLREDVETLDKLREMIGESRLVAVGTYIKSPRVECDCDYLIEADPESKVILNKLIYIYSNIRDFLEKHNISLKDILEDIDLYVSVAAVAATAT